MTGRSPNHRGSLLVEAMIALGLLAMCLAVVAALLVGGRRNQTAASDLGFATTSAVDKTEELQAASFATLAAGSDTVRKGAITFDRQWSVASDSPQPGMKTVAITVRSHRETRSGAPANITLRFYRAR